MDPCRTVASFVTWKELYLSGKLGKLTALRLLLDGLTAGEDWHPLPTWPSLAAHAGHPAGPSWGRMLNQALFVESWLFPELSDFPHLLKAVSKTTVEERGFVFNPWIKPKRS